MAKLRANSSGKTLLKYFISKVEEAGGTYNVVVPWDERNLQEVKEYYDVDKIQMCMDHYFKGRGPWKVKDFIFKLPDLVEAAEREQRSQENFKKLMQKTKASMKEAGLL